MLAGKRRVAKGKSVPVPVDACPFSIHHQLGLWCSLCDENATTSHLMSSKHTSNALLHAHIFGERSIVSAADLIDLLKHRPDILKRSVHGFSPEHLAVILKAWKAHELPAGGQHSVRSSVEGDMVHEFSIDTEKKLHVIPHCFSEAPFCQSMIIVIRVPPAF